MVQGIGSSDVSTMNMMAYKKQDVPLSEDQKSQLQEILAKYDPQKMSDSDMKSLFDELKSAGIGPSKEVQSIFEEAGFEMGKPPEGPPPNEQMSAKRPDFILEAIEKYESEGLTKDDISDLISQLKNLGEPPQGIFVDQKS